MRALCPVMLLRRSIFTSATVRPLAPFVNSRDLSALLFNPAKPRLSNFLSERINYIFGAPSREPGSSSRLSLMFGLVKIQLQISTPNFRRRSKNSKIKHTPGAGATHPARQLASALDLVSRADDRSKSRFQLSSHGFCAAGSGVLTFRLTPLSCHLFGG
jgi:hypothetical protein